MGRKGLGKLAGFGVAKTIEVVTKTAADSCAHGIRLDFDEILKLADTLAVKVPTFRLPDDAGLGSSGTRVTLSKLVHESVKSQEQTVRRSIGDHFVLIEQEDFAIKLNDNPAKPAPRKHVYAWPEPELPIDELVTQSIPSTETGQPVNFNFRLRFVEDRKALLASQRGVRVYAHKTTRGRAKSLARRYEYARLPHDRLFGWRGLCRLHRQPRTRLHCHGSPGVAMGNAAPSTGPRLSRRSNQGSM